MKTTKSPRRVLQYAYLVGQLVLPDYSHRYSRHDFTQPQLFACLALKEFLQLDYRKLAGAAPRCRRIGGGDRSANRVPHFTTFQKAAKRLLLNRHAQAYLDKTIRLAQVQGRLPRRVSLAALDGTGLESRHASSYYVKRRANTGKYWQKNHLKTISQSRRAVRYPNASHVGRHSRSRSRAGRAALRAALVEAHGARAALPRWRPTRATMASTIIDSRASTRRAIADPAAHRSADEEAAGGYWRRQMKSRLHLTRYAQRWQVETVHSMLNRLLGSALRARSYWSQCREILLRAITLNIMILRRTQGFLQSRSDPFSSPDGVSAALGERTFSYFRNESTKSQSIL